MDFDRFSKSVNGHRWTNDELHRLVQMWSADAALKTIAETLGATTFAINKVVIRLRKAGIPLKKRTRGHVAGRRNKPWTQEEVEYLVRRRAEKSTSEEIATDLDRTVYAVNGMIGKLRESNVNVGMLGGGVRKLWDAKVIALRMHDMDKAAIQ